MDKEFVLYLKSKRGLERLLILFKKKYESIGRYSGSVVITDVSEVESEDLSNFLGKRIYAHQDVKVSFKEISKKVDESKFKNVNWNNIFNLYFEEEVVSKKVLKLSNKLKEEEFYKSIIDSNKDNIYIDKISLMFNTDNEVLRVIRKRYCKNMNDLERDLNSVFLLLNNIPKKPTFLSVYASICGNPHFLDINTSSSNLFLRILCFVKNLEFPSTNRDKIDLFSHIMVYTDPYSNYVITYKLVGDSFLDELNKRCEVINLNLSNILNIKSISAVNKRVYIFENPSILSTLKDLGVTIVITSGMPNLALYELLSKLDSNGCKLYYNGDFDPEGLLIASKLKERFPKLNLFCYSKDDYINQKEKISLLSMNKLKNIHCKDLEVVKDLLMTYGLATYQEGNISNIRRFIVNEN